MYKMCCTVKETARCAVSKYTFCISDSSPSCDDSHAVLSGMPKNKASGSPYPFGIFPFLMISSVPDTSAIILMKNATSILPFII